jgi:hypothetical protein
MAKYSVRYTSRGRWIWTITVILTIINLISIMAGYVILGGDAYTGEEKENKYFVNSHGKYTEVTRAQWIYSYIHCLLFFVNVPAVPIIYFWLRAKGDISQRIDRLGW